MSNIGRKIVVTHHVEANWYRTGEDYTVLNDTRYEGIGVQVVRPGNGHVPDVVMNGDFEYKKEAK